MAGQLQNVTILFADICKSSKIYEVLGDQAAQQVIGRILSRLTDITEQLTRALEKIATLETSLSSVRCYPTPTHQPSTPSTMRNYCWTHGFRVGNNHNSMTCRTPKEGHQKGATAGNMMGGSKVGINSAK